MTGGHCVEWQVDIVLKIGIVLKVDIVLQCKLLFFGLSQCTEDGATSQQRPVNVLAEDTDDEND